MRATHLIDIIEFVDENEIDIRLYQRPYYLEPGKTAGKAYTLLVKHYQSKKSRRCQICTCIIASISLF